MFAPLDQSPFTQVMPPTENTPPKAFVSYSWTTGEYEQVVDELVDNLAGSGVELVYDKWDLHPGQDKYEYMERSVHDPSIGWVLILCDRGYAEKANDRRGGVGHETLILSPELYEDVRQRRAIPVIMERDEAGQPYLPAYLKVGSSSTCPTRQPSTLSMRSWYSCCTASRPTSARPWDLRRRTSPSSVRSRAPSVTPSQRTAMQYSAAGRPLTASCGTSWTGSSALSGASGSPTLTAGATPRMH